MSYVTPDGIDQALGMLADHCIVPRNPGEREAVFRAFQDIARSGQELREAIDREAASP